MFSPVVQGILPLSGLTFRPLCWDSDSSPSSEGFEVSSKSLDQQPEHLLVRGRHLVTFSLSWFPVGVLLYCWCVIVLLVFYLSVRCDGRPPGVPVPQRCGGQNLDGPPGVHAPAPPPRQRRPAVLPGNTTTRHREPFTHQSISNPFYF